MFLWMLGNSISKYSMFVFVIVMPFIAMQEKHHPKLHSGKGSIQMV